MSLNLNGFGHVYFVLIVDCCIQVLCGHPTEPFCVIGDTYGAVHFVHLVTGEIIYSQQTNSSRDVSFIAVDLSSVFNGKTLVVALSSGLVIRLSNIDFANLNSSILAGKQVIDDIKRNVSVETVNLKSSPNYVLAFSSELIICAQGDAPLSKWCFGYEQAACIDIVKRPLAGMNIVNAQMDPSRTFLVVVDDEFRFTLFNAATFVAIAKFCIPGAADFVLFQNPISLKKESCIATLIKKQSGTFISVLSLLDQKQLFSSAAPSNSCFVRRIGIKNSFQLVSIGKGDAGQIDIHLDGLFLTTSLEKVRSMVDAEAFDAAEILANETQINMQDVYKVKCDVLFKEISDSQSNTSVINKLERLVRRKIDYSCFIDLAISAKVSSADDLTQLLSCMQICLENAPSSLDSDSFTTLTHQVVQFEKRIATFAQFYTFDAQLWQKFRSSSILQIIMDSFQKHCILTGLAIWQRHASSIAEHEVITILNELPKTASVSEVMLLLREADTHVKTLSIRSVIDKWSATWARIIESRDAAPHNALKLMQFIDQFYSSSASSVQSLTTSFTPLKIVDFLVQKSQIALHPSNDDAHEPITKLLNALEDLVCLWDEHDLCLSLDEYENDTIMDIAMALLDRVSAPELIPAAIEKHVKPYLAHHEDLPLKSLLSEYCEHVMDASIGSGNPSLFESFEARVLAVVPLIEDIHLESTVVLQMMRRTPIPWSNELDAQIQRCIKVTAARTHKDIVEQSNLLQLKRMMLGYSITSFNISNLGLAKRLLVHILKQTNKLDAVDDALLVVRAYHHLKKLDVFLIRCRVLVQSGLIERCKSLLETGSEYEKRPESPEMSSNGYNASNNSVEISSQLTRGELSTVTQQLILWTLLQLEDSITRNDAVLFAQFAGVGVMLRGILDSVHVKCDDIPPLSVFQRCSRLLNDFGEAIHPRDIDEPSKLDEVLETFIRKQDLKKDGLHALTTVYRYADSLGFQRDATLRRLCMLLAYNGDVEQAFDFCRELCERYKGSAAASTLAACCQVVLRHLATNTKTNDPAKVLQTSKKLVHFARQALIQCDENDIQRYLSVFKDVEILYHVVLESDLGAYRESLKSNSLLRPEKTEPVSDGIKLPSYSSIGGSSSSSNSTLVMLQSQTSPTRIRMFDEQYREVGLVLNAKAVLEDAFTFVLSSMTLHESIWEHNLTKIEYSSRKGKKADTTVTYGIHTAHYNGKKLIEACLSNRHYQLALRISQRLIELTIPSSNSAQNIEDVEALVFADEYSQMSTSALKSLSQQVLSSTIIDKQYGLACMISLPMQISFSVFKNSMTITGSDFSRLVCIAQIGSMAGLIWSQRSFQVDCQTLAVHARWWQELQLLNIPFDESKFRSTAGSGEYQRSLLPLLITKTGGDIETALQFSSYYHIEDDFVYFEFIKQQLFGEYPADQYESGTMHHHVRIASVVADIANKERFIAVLSDECLPKISPYNYEDIRFVNEQILAVDATNRTAKSAILILDVLKGYKRTNPPRDKELQGASISKVVAKRLPFHALLHDPWSVLSPEINEESLSRLVPLCFVLEIPADRLHISLINSKLTLLKEAAVDWRDPVSVWGLRFTDFRALLSKIKDHESAVQTTVYVAGCFPCGPDRISTYKLAIQFSERWLSAVSSRTQTNGKEADDESKAGRTIVRLKQLTNQTETEYQLRANKLDKLLAYHTKPIELCVQLFKFGSVESHVKCDIHYIVDCIVKRYDLNLEDIQLMILQRLLKQEIIEGDSVEKQELEIQQHIIFLFRQDVKKGSQRLLQLAYMDNVKVTTSTRIRALSVLLQLVDLKDVNSRKGYDEEVRTYLRMLMYLKEFEELRIVQSLQELHSCDKGALARSLWLSHRNDLKALRLVCKLCIDYRVFDGELLHNALHELVAKQDYRFVIDVIQAMDDMNGQDNLFLWIPQFWRNVAVRWIKSWLKEQKPQSLDEKRLIEFSEILKYFTKFPYQRDEFDGIAVDLKAFAIHNQSESEDVFIAAILGLTCLPQTVVGANVEVLPLILNNYMKPLLIYEFKMTNT